MSSRLTAEISRFREQTSEIFYAWQLLPITVVRHLTKKAKTNNRKNPPVRSTFFHLGVRAQYTWGGSNNIAKSEYTACLQELTPVQGVEPQATHPHQHELLGIPFWQQPPEIHALRNGGDAANAWRHPPPQGAPAEVSSSFCFTVMPITDSICCTGAKYWIFV